MCSVASVMSQLFAIPWTVAYQALLFMEFSWQESWNGLPCLPPGHLPDLGIEPRSPALQADSLPSEPPGKSLLYVVYTKTSIMPLHPVKHSGLENIVRFSTV